MVISKVQFNLYLPSEPKDRVEVLLYCFFNLGTRRGGWLTHTPAPLPPGMTGTHCMGAGVCPGAGLDGCRKSCPTRNQFPDNPVHRKSLYLLHHLSPHMVVGLWKNADFFEVTPLQWFGDHSKCCLAFDLMVITNELLKVGMLYVFGMEICLFCTEFHCYVCEVDESQGT